MTAPTPDLHEGAIRHNALDAAIARALTIDGWMEPDELRWLGETAATMRDIVEIGCWKGRSTSVLLAMCPGRVYPVDHWLGGKDEPEFIRERAKNERIMARFLENVGVTEEDSPTNLSLVTSGKSSLEAVPYIAAIGGVDMVFVDGGHGYEEVRADIRAWLPKTKRLICGHDFFDPRVRKAVYDELGNVESAAGSIWAKVLG